MCWFGGETVDHLLIHCEVAFVKWSLDARLFGIHWVLPGRVVDLLSRWRNWFGKHYLAIWKFTQLCLM